jgi:hypothetical protein
MDLMNHEGAKGAKEEGRRKKEGNRMIFVYFRTYAKYLSKPLSSVNSVPLWFVFP